MNRLLIAWAFFAVALAAPPAHAAPPEPPQSPELDDEVVFDAERRGSSGRHPQGPPASAAARRHASWPETPAAIALAEATQLLARFGTEISVSDVQRAAVRQALLEPGRAASWLQRARRAAALPTLKVGVSRELRRYDSLLTTPNPQTEARAELLFEVSATWHLDRLVFNRDEVRAGREAVRMQVARTELLFLVTHLYFQRRALQVELIAATPTNLEVAVAKRLRLDELTAALEGLIGRKLARQNEPR